jgi:hypothetical protein
MSMRWIVLLTVLGALTGCDPIYGVYIQQTLAPAPTRECVSAALDDSPNVVEWAPLLDEENPSFQVFFRDSLPRRTRTQAWVVLGEATDSGAVLRVEREHCCGAQVVPRPAFVAHASELLPEIRRACRAEPRSPVRCRHTGLLGMRSCEAPQEQDGHGR